MHSLYNNLTKYIKISLIIIVILLLIYKLYLPIIKISLPFVTSLIIAYLLSPAVKYLNSKKIPIFWGVIIIYTFIIIGLTFIISYLYPVLYRSFEELIIRMPLIFEKYSFLINEMIIRYEISNLPYSIKNILNQNISDVLNSINKSLSHIVRLIESIASNLFYILLIPFITFYFLKDGDYLKSKLVSVIPSKYREDSIVTWYQIDLILKKFIRGELLVGFIVGTLTATGMYLVGVKYPLILGIIAGVTNIIPYLGPFIGIVPSILVALVESPVLAIKATLVFIIIQQIEAGIISPKIVGNYVGLHPITIIFVLLFAEQLFGLAGMFFAVPVTLVFLVILDKVLSMITNTVNEN